MDMERHRREHAERELGQVKDLMQEQMAKAEQICADVEARYRALPNPFEDEVTEVRERVEQQKVGIENLRLENETLQREMRNVLYGLYCNTNTVITNRTHLHLYFQLKQNVHFS